MTATNTKNSIPTSHKIAWIIGLIVVTLLVISELSGDNEARSAPTYPAGAYAECSDFFDLMDSDLDGDALMIGVATVAKTAEGGPVEAEAAEVFNAGMSRDQQRSVAAVSAMTAACNR